MLYFNIVLVQEMQFTTKLMAHGECVVRNGMVIEESKTRSRLLTKLSPSFLDPEVHCHIRKSPLFTVLSHMTPVHILASC